MKAMIAVVVLMLISTAGAQAQGPLPALIRAVALQESGLDPLALNVAGRSYRPATRKEAEDLIHQALKDGRSFDVGLMQINSWWIHRYDIPPVSLLDPDINMRWGKWILKQEIKRHGFTWKAVGKYHTPDLERGRRYAWRVFRHYAGPCASLEKEAERAQQKTDHQILSRSTRIRRDQGIRRPGRIVSFDIQQESMPWSQRPKPGTP